MGHGPHFCKNCVSFCVLFVCKCVLNYCHRVATQLQLTNISYHIILHYIRKKILFAKSDKLFWCQLECTEENNAKLHSVREVAS
jgi:hypothetical protein